MTKNDINANTGSKAPEYVMCAGLVGPNTMEIVNAILQITDM